MSPQRIRRVVATVTLLAAASVAQAGLDRDGTVRIYVNSAAGLAWATGAVTDARYTGSSPQRIGCSINSRYGVRCRAVDSAGSLLSCWLEDPSETVIAAVSAINPSSRIDFYPEAGTSRCLTIYVRNDSGNL
jgi:hypothetical protein